MDDWLERLGEWGTGWRCWEWGTGWRGWEWGTGWNGRVSEELVGDVPSKFSFMFLLQVPLQVPLLFFVCLFV